MLFVDIELEMMQVMNTQSMAPLERCRSIIGANDDERK